MIRYTLYLPSEPNPGMGGMEHRLAVTDVRLALCDLFGGHTTIRAAGEWRDDNGRVVSEPVDIVTVLHALDDSVIGASTGLNIVDSLARQFKTAARQDTVLYTHESISGRFV